MNLQIDNVYRGKSGAPGEIRTPDPLLRRQMLYPAELRARRLELDKFTALGDCFATAIPEAVEPRSNLGAARPSNLHN